MMKGFRKVRRYSQNKFFGPDSLTLHLVNSA